MGYWGQNVLGVVPSARTYVLLFSPELAMVGVGGKEVGELENVTRGQCFGFGAIRSSRI